MSYDKYSKEAKKGQKPILIERSGESVTTGREQLQRYVSDKDIEQIAKEKESQQVKTSDSSPVKTTPTIANPE